jgi:D-inositol-3-phosphate glycosyltransferase
VVAARVGGLPTAVADGVSGLLVDGHDPRDWAEALCSVVSDPERLDRWSRNAVVHAAGFGWDATADATLEVYRDAMADRVARRGAVRSAP